MEKIAILDCGGQYTKVIDRKVRELEVNCDIFPISVPAEKLEDYSGIILSGGPESVWDTNALKPDSKIFDSNKPILGICYGMQLINSCFGGIVSPHVKKEYGEAVVSVDTECKLFSGLESRQSVLMSHGDTVETVAAGFSVSAYSGEVIAGIYDEKRKIYGLQFHPEVDLTENGKEMLKNFLRSICELKERYSLQDRIEASVKNIREKVGDSSVVVLVSGGVDSAVTAALLLKALDPKKVFAIHIDHGFMRKDESDAVCEALKMQGLVNLERVNAADRFLNTVIDKDGVKIGPLSKTTDPEDKRAIIGQVFFNTVQEAAIALSLDFDTSFLAQGTLRPDLIESGNPDVSSYAKKIKTHHNDVDIIREYRNKGRVIETNSDWHKDEVRKVALMLGLDEDIAHRQPFPGPGLAVRLLCSDGSAKADSAIEEELRFVCSEEDTRAHILPVRSVGVQGDNRTYGALAMLNCVSFEWEKIYALSKQITNGIRAVNRVTYCFAGDFDGEIKQYPMYAGKETVDILRELDFIVTSKLGGVKLINQTFAVLLPIGVSKKYSVAIRTFVTNDFMTGRPAFVGKEIPLNLMKELVKEIKDRFDDIEFVLYDVTSKPPATCEWE